MNLSQLRHQWVPVCAKKNLSNHPQRFLLLGKPLVIYCIKDNVVILQDRCPHRGIPLSKGKLDGEILQCQYHGWRFNSSGACVGIPGLVKNTSLVDKCVPAYPVRIHYGLVFVCLEENETTFPLYHIPALDNKDYHFHLMQFQIQGDILNIIENTLDATHTHYVHPGLLRRESQRQSITAKLTVTASSAEVLYEEEQKPGGIISSLFEKSRTSSIGRFHAPLIIELEYLAQKNITAAFTFFICPMSDKEHKVFLLISYKHHWLMSRLKKILFYPFIKIAFLQDLRVLKLQEMNKHWFPKAGFKSTDLDILRSHIERIVQNKSKDYKKTINMEI